MNAESDKADLIKKAQSGELMKDLVKLSNWEPVKKIFTETAFNALTTLSKNEDVEARATLKVIDEIYGKIDKSIAIGEEAKKLYLKRYGEN